MKYTLQELADYTGGQIVGDPQTVIERVATLTRADSGAISFLTNATYRQYLANTSASAVILQ
ncbi:MAG: LpxD N-terminal domain-containing protein [Pseudomonadota bacterium]